MEENIIAPYLLRAYAWQIMKANLGMSETDYEGKAPLVPLGEREEIKKYGKPYIVYAYTEQSPNRISAKSVGNMAFVIQADEFSKLVNISNVLARAFERADQSATDLNEFSSTISGFIGLRFGTIELAFVDVSEPEESEGGEMTGVVNIRYEYYANYDGLVTSIAHWDAGSQSYVKN
jgi:hypothetical protein